MGKRRNEVEAMTRSEPFAYRAEYDSDNNVEFEAWAVPGASTADAVWICAKHVYSSLNLIRTEWAKDSDDKVADFTNKADGLSSLTYV